MITHNADTWLNISKKTVKVLDNLFHRFCQKIYWVGSGCPKPNYYWQSASLKFSNIILKKKLNFIHHIANLPPDALANEVYELQVEHGGGLLNELEEHLHTIGVTDLRSVSKWQWKKVVRQYISNLNKTQLLEDIKGYKNSVMMNYHKNNLGENLIFPL